jgi:nucleotidyltransferase/DNA polymerase involved in DNA repair
MPYKESNLFLHMDGDSFFVACEIAQNPQYKNQPVVVGADRGIAVAMSYEAKKLGVTRGMPVFQIKKDYPSVIVLPHHFKLYTHISTTVFSILQSYLEKVEAYSIDECFAIIKPADIAFAGSLEKLLNQIKQEVFETCGVTYSFGVGRTKALAKTASKAEKPNGVVVLIDRETEERVLQATPIADVWGIGRQTAPKLKKLGIFTALDFCRYPQQKIIQTFAKPLYQLQQELSGISVFELNDNPDQRDQKSIQSTSTFQPASSHPSIIFAELSKNIELACEQARSLKLVSRNITVFVKDTQFMYSTEHMYLSVYTSDPGTILEALERIFPTLYPAKKNIRSTGVTLSQLIKEEDTPRDLFDKQDQEKEKNTLNVVVDALKKKFGTQSIERASSLRGQKRERGNTFPK